MKNMSAVAYVFGACLFGVVAAIVRVPIANFAGWLGAACAGPLAGLVVALIVRAFRKTTNVPRLMFWISLVVLAMNALPRTPAP
jgi:hypothetical protein